MAERGSHDVTAADGTRLNVREAVPGGAREGVFFVHGATYGSRAGFDPPVPGGYSTWFDAVTRRRKAAFSLDVRDAAAGDPPYDPAVIDVPTPVVRGSLDAESIRDDALGLYDGLGFRGHRKEYVEVGGGTHKLALERDREALFDAVDGFQRRFGR